VVSSVLDRISRPSYEPLYATNNSHCKYETFIRIESFCPQKMAQYVERGSVVVYTSSMVAILTMETSL
jgi:hypothetical protein